GDNLSDKGDTDTKFYNFNADHIARSALSITASCSLPDKDHPDGVVSTVSDDIRHTLRYLDTSVIAKTTVLRAASYTDDKKTAESNRYYDANGEFNAATCVMSPYRDTKDSGDGCNAYAETSLNGRVLKHIFTGTKDHPEEVFTSRYFQTPRGDITAKVGPLPHHSNPDDWEIQLVGNPIETFSQTTLMRSLSAPVFEGDTWQSIARRVLGSEKMAEALQIYSGIPLTPNTQINISAMLNRYFKTTDISAYEQLVNSFYNSLTVAVSNPEVPPPPKPKHKNFWDLLLGALVVILILSAIPPNLTIFFTNLLHSAFLGYFTVGAAAGALANAAQQGIAIAFNDQHGFSTSQMLKFAGTTGLTLGLSHALGIDAASMATQITHGIAKYGALFVKQLALNTAIQLYELGIRGGRGKFDIEMILEQSTAAILQASMDDTMPTLVAATKNVADEIPGIATGLVFGHCPSAADMTANAIGSVACNMASPIHSQEKVEVSGNKNIKNGENGRNGGNGRNGKNVNNVKKENHHGSSSNHTTHSHHAIYKKDTQHAAQRTHHSAHTKTGSESYYPDYMQPNSRIDPLNDSAYTIQTTDEIFNEALNHYLPHSMLDLQAANDCVFHAGYYQSQATMKAEYVHERATEVAGISGVHTGARSSAAQRSGAHSFIDYVNNDISYATGVIAGIGDAAIDTAIGLSELVFDPSRAIIALNAIEQKTAQFTGAILSGGQARHEAIHTLENSITEGINQRWHALITASGFESGVTLGHDLFAVGAIGEGALGIARSARFFGSAASRGVGVADRVAGWYAGGGGGGGGGGG
ncbi:MAG: hypothetical protein ACD_60C00061G0001, partial [uncultured bacterium]